MACNNNIPQKLYLVCVLEICCVDLDFCVLRPDTNFCIRLPGKVFYTQWYPMALCIPEVVYKVRPDSLCPHCIKGIWLLVTRYPPTEIPTHSENEIPIFKWAKSSCHGCTAIAASPKNTDSSSRRIAILGIGYQIFRNARFQGVCLPRME